MSHPLFFNETSGSFYLSNELSILGRRTSKPYVIERSTLVLRGGYRGRLGDDRRQSSFFHIYQDVACGTNDSGFGSLKRELILCNASGNISSSTLDCLFASQTKVSLGT